MRRFVLIIGLLALLASSVFVTVYFVNHPRRARPGENLEVGVVEPDRVLDPTELFQPPAPRPPGGPLPGAEEATQPDMSRPTGYILTYPDWEPGIARVEAATAVTDAAGYTHPVWSPVGLDLALTRDPADAIYLASPVPGTQPRLLASDKGIGQSFSWTLDGMSIRAQGEDRQWAELLITGERFPVPEPETNVFVRDDRIYFRPENGDARQISGLEDRFVEPMISPDELKVVYRGRETGLYIGLTDGSRAIYVGPGTHAKWLPDSSGIVYDQLVSDGSTVVDGDLWMATVDGRLRSNLTNTPGIIEAYPSIAPEGERIAFSAGGAIYVGKLIR